MIYIAVEELHTTLHLSLHVQEQNQSIVFLAGSCGGLVTIIHTTVDGP